MWIVSGAALFAAVLIPGASATQRYIELASIGPDGGNGPVGTPQNTGYSADGSSFFFVTSESLVSADTDTQNDVYKRSGGQTTLISAGQINGNAAHSSGLITTTPDGSHVFFSTPEQLVPADSDTRFDIYDRSGGSTTLVSVGPPGSEALSDANTFVNLNASSTDGSVVYFSLHRSATFNTVQYFRRSGGSTIEIHPNWPRTFFCGASSDGTKAWMVTPRNIVPGDTDPDTGFGGTRDVYEWSGGSWTLVSTGPTVSHTSAEAFCVGASSDTTRVFFTTSEALVADDTDSASDVYERSSGQTTLLSVGPNGGNGAFSVNQAQTTPDGSRLFFTTQESLVVTDTDASWDVYERSAGVTTLVSTGPTGGAGADNSTFIGASADGSRVYFSTVEALVASDTDASWDVFERTGGQTKIATQGPAGGNGAFDVSGGAFGNRSVLYDGSFLFGTDERLAGVDTDDYVDIYEWDGLTTKLVSVGSAGGNGAFHSWVDGVSEDGSHVAVRTEEALVAADTDSQFDMYDATIVPVDGTTQSVLPGGTVSTGGTPSPADPVETSVTTPVGGQVTITDTEATGPAPAGFELLGMAIDITAPAATAADPLTLVFRIDGSLLGPAGLDHTSVQVLKDGVAVAACDTAVPADPDPCVAARSPLAEGGAEITVSTSTASLWSFGSVLDSTPPTITPNVTGTLGSNGWYVSNVEVSWTVTDPDSPISSQSGCDTTTVNADTAGDTLTCEAASGGGESSESVTVKRDATAPIVTCAVGAPGPVYLLGGAGGNVSAGVEDSMSGAGSGTVSAAAAVSTVGNRTVQLTGVDQAGNDSSVNCPYRVAYRYVPKSPAAQSSYNAGSTVSVKFSIANAGGTRISDAAAQALVAGCKVKVGLGSATGCATYNAASDLFQFDVKTPKNATPSTYAVIVDVLAPDGSGLVNREQTPVVLR